MGNTGISEGARAAASTARECRDNRLFLPPGLAPPAAAAATFSAWIAAWSMSASTLAPSILLLERRSSSGMPRGAGGAAPAEGAPALPGVETAADGPFNRRRALARLDIGICVEEAPELPSAAATFDATATAAGRPAFSLMIFCFTPFEWIHGSGRRAFTPCDLF